MLKPLYHHTLRKVAMAIKNVVLVGAGGTIGPYILASLAKAGFNVTILSRQSSTSTFGDHKVAKVADGYPRDELVAAFKGQDAIVSTISVTGSGRLDTATQKLLIDAAIEAGVQRFIPSEFGGDNRNAAATALSPIYRAKLDIVEYLQAKKGQIEYTIVPTGPFFELYGFPTQYDLSWCIILTVLVVSKSPFSALISRPTSSLSRKAATPSSPSRRCPRWVRVLRQS